MADIQQLEQIFGKTFEKQSSLTALRQFRANNAYCLNEDEEVIGLCFCENEVEKLKLPEETKVLDKLEYLNLSDNGSLKQLQIEVVLPELKHLDISDSGLEKLKLPAGYKSLQWLDISRNKLKELEFAGGLPKLTYLDLTDNKLTTLSLNAAELEYLFLNNNELEKLDFTSKIPTDLKMLQLRKNKLKELPNHFLSLTGLQVLYLDDNPLTDIPEEVVGKGETHNSLEDIRNYLQSIEDSGGQREFLYQAKMVLVGNGEVGKTSIRIKLLDESAPLPTKENRTQGLDLATYTIEGLEPSITELKDPIDFQLHIWDFGGQGKYREIQQLFCSRKTLYLFVTAHDEDVAPEEYYGFEYWLSMVHAYSYDEKDESPSPVIHVVNKIDEEVKYIDQKSLIEKFPNVERFIHISCKTKQNLDQLKSAIRQILPVVNKDMFTDGYSPTWIAVKKALEESKGKNHITYQEYLNICKDNDLDDQQSETWLRILHRIGTVIYFGNNPDLKDWIILNPQWVKEALFQVLDSKVPIRGVLTPNQFSSIWPSFEQDEHQHLIALMKAYYLCYEQKNPFGGLEYIIPALLPATKPTFPNYLKDPVIYLKFNYDPFIPAGTVNKLMVDKNDLIHSNLKWKNNVIFHDPLARSFAHIWEDWEDKAVYIDLYGSELQGLYQQIYIALGGLTEKLKETRFLHHLDFKVEGFYQGKWVDGDLLARLDKKFTFLDPEYGIRSKSKKPKVFISYAHKDDNRLFEAFVKGIKEYCYDDWDLFEDRNILIGEDWHQRLQKEVQDCNFAIFLLSPNFFRSKYIKDHEFRKFVERNTADGFPFFSVMLRTCDIKRWEEIAEKQMFSPYGRDYGINSEKKKDQIISFNDLVRFDHNGNVLPTSELDDFFRDLVKAINRALDS